MRWLSRGPARDRSTPDRGATAVFVAICMVVLVGFTALAVDVGAMWSDKQQLQNGADAGALAIAQSCAGGDCNSPVSAAGQAASYAGSNKLDANAAGVVTDLNTAAHYVTVRDSSTRRLWFAPVIGIDTADIAATATARWENTSGGNFLPLAFSLCAFYAQTGAVVGDPIPSGTEMTLLLKSKKDQSAAITAENVDGQCLPNTSAAHNEVSGGFGWLQPDGGAGTCLRSVQVGDWVASKPGGSVPCSIGDTLQGKTVEIPIFNDCRRDAKGNCLSGNNAAYLVYAIAGFEVTGYCFSPRTDEWNAPVCNDSNPWISGRFVTFTSPDSSSPSDPGAPDLGANQVALIN